MLINIKLLFFICTKFIIENEDTVKYIFMEMSNLHWKLSDILQEPEENSLYGNRTCLSIFDTLSDQNLLYESS
jgi:hypothetical protein